MSTLDRKSRRRLLLASSALGCTDERVVGTRAEAAALCNPACESAQRCHPELEQCVDCVESNDCLRSPSGPLCDTATNACRSCDAGEACPPWLCEDDDDDDADELFDTDDDDDCDLDESDASIDL